MTPLPTNSVLNIADLRDGTHMIRFAWHNGPDAKGVSLHIFPNTDISSMCDHTNHMTRRGARMEWQRLLLSGFVVDRSSGWDSTQPDAERSA